MVELVDKIPGTEGLNEFGMTDDSWLIGESTK